VKPIQGNSAGRVHAAGFTLLEILVVVVIIGILATFATLSIGNRALDDRLEVESKRLEQTFRLAADEAETKGVEIGFRYTQSRYEFLATDKDGLWAPYSETGPLRSRPMPAPFFLQLYIEGRPVPPAPDAEPGEVKKTEKKIVPQILLLSSGEVTAFALDIKAENYAPYYRLEADTLGKFERARHQDGS
jgi:general secretion pathway protein H